MGILSSVLDWVVTIFCVKTCQTLPSEPNMVHPRGPTISGFVSIPVVYHPGQGGMLMGQGQFMMPMQTHQGQVMIPVQPVYEMPPIEEITMNKY